MASAKARGQNETLSQSAKRPSLINAKAPTTIWTAPSIHLRTLALVERWMERAASSCLTAGHTADPFAAFTFSSGRIAANGSPGLSGDVCTESKS